MNFGQAIEAIKQDKLLARIGWNGKNMYIYLTRFNNIDSNISYEPTIVMHNAQGQFQPGWLASQADMLAEDWVIIAQYNQVQS